MKYLTAMLMGGLMLFALGACSDSLENVTKAKTEEAKDVTEEEGQELSFSNEDSSVEFLGQKVTGEHEGGFKKFTGTAVIEGDTLKQVSVEIDMNSIWTDDPNDVNEKLTGHLKAEDFFYVAEHPTARFITTAVEKGGDGASHTVTGNLTMRGVTKSIAFPADITVKDGKVTAKANFKINRMDWNVDFPGMEGNLIKEEVGLTLDVSASS